MDTGQHENLPPGLASAAPRSLLERGQTYNPRTAHKDCLSPRTPHKEQERRIQAPTSMEKIRTVPRSYRTLTESKVLALDKFLADIATCEEFLARTPAPGDVTARGKSSPRGEGNRAIGLKERQNLALYNPQQETFSARFSLMAHAPDTPAVQFLLQVQKLMAVHQVMLTTDYARITVSKLGNEFLRDSVQTDLRSFRRNHPESDTVTFSLLRRFIETWEANHTHQMETYSKDLSQHSPPHRLEKRFSRQLADVPRDRIDALLSQDGSSPRTPHRDEEQSLSRRLTAQSRAERRAEILRFEIRREAAWELALTATPGNRTSRRSTSRGEGKPRPQATNRTDDQGWLQTRNLPLHQDYQEFTEYSDVLYNDLVPLRARFAHTTRTTNPGVTSAVIGCEDSPPKPKDTGFATVVATSY